MKSEEAKNLWAHMAGGIGMLAGLLAAPWALWALGRNKNKDPLLEVLERQRTLQEKHEHAEDLATWANTRAGAYLEMALGLSEAQGQESMLRAAILYAACAAGARQSASDHATARSEAEDVWLAEHGVEVPAWSRAWVFAKEHLHEAQRDETLFPKIVEMFADVEEKLRPKAEERGHLAKVKSGPGAYGEIVGGWSIDFKAESRAFGDLTETERAEVLQSRPGWKVVDILSARWTKVEVPATEPAPGPEGTP